MKLKDLIQSLRDRLPSWKRTLKVFTITIKMVLVCAICWTVYYSYTSGYEAGRRVGQCEIGCWMQEGQLDSVDDEGICWCVPLIEEEVFLSPVPKI